MEALRGDRPIQAIAAKHEVHPNQVSGWKRQAQEGLWEVFAGGANRRQADQETVIHDLHAKIGELTNPEHRVLSRSRQRCRTPASGVRWTAAAGVWTTRSSSGCGDR